MSPFRLQVPTQLIFGAAERRALGTTARRFGTRAATVTGRRSLAASGHATELDHLMTAAGVEIVERLVAAGEPDSSTVSDAARRLTDSGAQVVVAIGGGSALDLGKAAAVLSGTDGQLADLLSGARIDEPRGLPLIALPTTAGTGAELSWGAIVLDLEAGRKRGIRGAGVAARVAIVDPELTVSATAQVTAEAGFDAVAHCIETSASRASHSFAQTLAGDALARLLGALQTAIDAPNDLRARSENAYAAAMMGINLAASTTCLPHRLQYPVGALTGTSHPRGVAALMPAWLDRTVRLAPGALATLARRAGLVERTVDDTVAARVLRGAIRDLLAAIGLELRLSNLGVDRHDIGDLVARVEGSVANDPGPVEPDDLVALYRASL